MSTLQKSRNRTISNINIPETTTNIIEKENINTILNNFFYSHPSLEEIQNDFSSEPNQQELNINNSLEPNNENPKNSLYNTQLLEPHYGLNTNTPFHIQTLEKVILKTSPY